MCEKPTDISVYDTADAELGLLQVGATDATSERELALIIGARNFIDCISHLEKAGFKRIIVTEPAQFMPLPTVAEVIDADLRALSFAAGTIDLIVCCNTLFFEDSEGIQEFIDRSYDWLKLGGALACNFLGERDNRIIEGRMSGYLKDEEVGSLRDKFPHMHACSFELDDQGPGGVIKHAHIWNVILKK